MSAVPSQFPPAERAPRDQYLRKISLFVSNDKNVLDLSSLRIEFRTTQSDMQTPNIAMVRVYNLKQETITTVLKEFNTVTLQAGYRDGAFAVVYSGQIVQFKRGKISSIDSYLDIFASDGSQVPVYATINVSLQAGKNSPQDILDAQLKEYAKYGITPDAKSAKGSDLSNWGGVRPERGKVMAGGLQWLSRQFARNTRTTLSVQNGKLMVIKKDGYVPGSVYRVNAASGMIGMPEATIQGVTVTILLNPLIQIGQLIHIDNASINQTLWPGQTQSGMPGSVFDPQGQGGLPSEIEQRKPPATRIGFPGIQEFPWYANVTADGLYRVLVIEHHGDSRGNDWYSDIVALAIDPTRKPEFVNPFEIPAEPVPFEGTGQPAPAAPAEVPFEGTKGVPKDEPKGIGTVGEAPTGTAGIPGLPGSPSGPAAPRPPAANGSDIPTPPPPF